jgi:hypothetical protein
MAIVLIEWSIKPDNDSITEFMDWWRDHAIIHDKSGLTGEFLSAPVPKSELSLSVEVDDLGTSEAGASAWKFINVGFWRDHQTFREQVGKYMTDEPKSFEAGQRRRIVLEPQEWRLGEWPFAFPTCS